MKFSDVYKDYAPYKNANGMYPWTQNPPAVTQNDTLFTCYAFMGILDSADKDDDFMHFEDQLKYSYLEHLRSDGATMRTPTSGELDSNDNLVGWGYMSRVLNPYWSEIILKFARANAWEWPGDPDQLRAWLGRHRAIEAHLMLATWNEVPDFLLQFFWTFCVYQGPVTLIWNRIRGQATQLDADSFSLTYVMVRQAIECDRTPTAMKLGAYIWWLCFALGGGMRKNLENWGWKGSPHAKYIK